MIRDLKKKHFGATTQEEFRKEVIDEIVEERAVTEQAATTASLAMAHLAPLSPSPYDQNWGGPTSRLTAGPPCTVMYRSEFDALAHSNEAIVSFNAFSAVMFSRWLVTSYGPSMLNSANTEWYMKQYEIFRSSVAPRWAADLAVIIPFIKKPVK